MITLNLDQHSRAAVYVELDQEYGTTIDLSFEHESLELGRWTPRETTLEAERARNGSVTDAAGGDVDVESQLRQELFFEKERHRRTTELLDHYEEELRRVVKMLEHASEQTLDRKLLPEEARELAAMLVHYAERAEAPK